MNTLEAKRIDAGKSIAELKELKAENRFLYRKLGRLGPAVRHAASNINEAAALLDRQTRDGFIDD